VANSKMRVMILCTLGSEGQSIRVDASAETLDSVGESRVERIRHQYQCWVYPKKDGHGRRINLWNASPVPSTRARPALDNQEAPL